MHWGLCRLHWHSEQATPRVALFGRESTTVPSGAQLGKNLEPGPHRATATRKPLQAHLSCQGASNSAASFDLNLGTVAMTWDCQGHESHESH
jgi:hypothetical protein